MAMDALTAAILKTFQETLLGSLAEHLHDLNSTPIEERQKSQSLEQILDESLHVLQALRQWSATDEPAKSDFGTPSHLVQEQHLVEDFLANADLLMEKLSIDLEMLHRGVHNEHSLEEIFRAMHTLKGVAGMFSFQHIALVAHHCETALSVIRERSVSISELQLQKFSTMHGQICAMLDEIRQGEAGSIDPNEIVAQLSGPFQEGPKKDLSPLGSEEECLIYDGNPKLADACQHKLLDCLANLNGDRGRLRAIETKIKNEHPHSSTTSIFTATIRTFEENLNTLQSIIVDLGLVPIFEVFNRCQRIARQITRETGKPINLFIAGEDTRVDRSVAEKITEPLVHLLRNACDHGIESVDERRASGKSESGKITLSAKQQGNELLISVRDDGAGLDVKRIKAAAVDRGLIAADLNLTDAQIHQLIFEPGLTTAPRVTKISGRGIGMDVVKARVAELEGSISITTLVGGGTAFTLHIPIKKTFQASLLFDADSQIYGVPITALQRSVRIHADQIKRVGSTDHFQQGEDVIPIVRLSDVIQGRNVQEQSTLCGPSTSLHYALVLSHGGKRFGLVVDRLRASEDVFVKPNCPAAKHSRLIAGSAILPSGQVAMMLDPHSLDEAVRAQLLQEPKA